MKKANKLFLIILVIFCLLLSLDIVSASVLYHDTERDIDGDDSTTTSDISVKDREQMAFTQITKPCISVPGMMYLDCLTVGSEPQCVLTSCW